MTESTDSLDMPLYVRRGKKMNLAGRRCPFIEKNNSKNSKKLNCFFEIF
jgi:hypothetical protein